MVVVVKGISKNSKTTKMISSKAMKRMQNKKDKVKDRKATKNVFKATVEERKRKKRTGHNI